MNLRIEKLVYGGEGLARQDGRTIFVPFVLPDERVAVEPAEERKKFIRARLVEVLEPSADRVSPPCRHFGVCGGCQYQHIRYERQLQAKGEILRETLSRIGHIPWDGPITAHASPPFGYRNRAQWKLRSHAGEQAIGYFRAGTTALCPAEECPVLAPRLEETLGALRDLAARGALPEAVREIAGFLNPRTNDLLLTVSLRGFPASPGALVKTLREALSRLASLLLVETPGERMELDGPGFLHYEAAGRSHRVGHLSFFQVNRFLVDEMAEAVANGEKGRVALDLFAGVGLFAGALAGRFEKVIAVESDPAAARDLAINLEVDEPAAQAVNADAERFLSGWHEKPDLVVLDPPRAGVAAGALERLAHLKPERITYVSCDPSTLARDLERLASTGYALAELHLFDVFPETFHIESLARLVRSGP
jgi:23S rRNA (uracil1939-C5)-methyltransferase